MNKDNLFLQNEEITRVRNTRNRFGGRLVVGLIVLFALFTMFAAGLCAGQSDLLPSLVTDPTLSQDLSDGALVAHAGDASMDFGLDAFNNSSRETGWTGTASNSSKSDSSAVNRKETSCSCTVSFSGTALSELRSKGKLQYYIEADWWHDGGSYKEKSIDSTSLTGNGYSLTNKSWTNCPSGLTQVTLWAKGHVLGWWNSWKTITVSISLRVKFRSADTDAPTVSLTATTTAEWKTEKKVTVTATDAVHSSLTASCKTNSGSAVSISQNGTNYSTTVNVTTPLIWTVQDRSYNSTNPPVTFSLVQMKIDRVNPSLSDIGFYNAGTATAISGVTTGNVDMRCTAKDNESGVKSVTAKNNQTGKDYTGVSVGNNVYKFSNITNGTYTITVTDNVNHVVTQTASYSGLDQQSPTVATEYNKTTETSYARDAVKITFTVVDRAGHKDTADATEKTIADACGTAYKDLRGVTFVLTGPNNITNSSATGTIAAVKDSETYANGIYTYKYTAYMAITGNYTYTATDTAGNKATGSIYSYVDTSAPRIISWVTDVDQGISAMTKWSNKETIQLTVTASDSPNVSGYVNKGSGLKEVKLQKNVGSTDFSVTKQFNGATSVTFELTANYNEIQSYKIIVYDKAGNSSDMSGGSATYNGTAYSNYFLNENAANIKTPVIYKDSNPVVVKIFKEQACTTLYAENGKVFVDQWRNTPDTTFYVQVTFGPSGGTLKQKIDGKSPTTVNTNVDAPLNKASYPNGASDPSFNKSNNVKVYQITVSTQGLVTYDYTFENGAKTSADSGTMTTRLDRVGPNVTLLGFGTGFTSGTYTQQSQVISGIAGFISEAAMYDRSDWYGSMLKAYILIDDLGSTNGLVKGSGVLGTAQTYNTKQDTTASQASGATTSVTFKYEGYTATESVYYNYLDGVKGSAIFPGQNGSLCVLEIPLFDYRANGDASGVLLRKAQKAGKSIVKNDGSLDLNWGSGTPFTYNITVHDFAGNATSVINKGNSTDLSYKVDPFEPSGSVVSVKTADGANYDCAPTDGPGAVAGKKWTRQAINVVVDKTQMGLSETFVRYGTTDIFDNTDENGLITSVTGTKSANIADEWKTPTVDGAMSTSATITFTAESRSAQLFFRVFSCGGAKHDDFVFFNGKYVCIRQDTDIPVVYAVFFSTDPNLRANYYENSDYNSNILLYYEVEENDDDFSLNRIFGSTDSEVFTHQKVYTYVLASDYNGTGLGSGIKYVKTTVNGAEEYYYTFATAQNSSKVAYHNVENPYEYLYRSASASYGYEVKAASYGLKLYIGDNQNNEREFSVDSDSAGRKLFPIVDTVIPELSISNATYGANATSYLAEGRFAGSDGNPISESLNITFRYVSGISDAWIYLRQRPFGEDIDEDAPVCEFNSDASAGLYGFVKNAGINFVEWKSETFNGNTYPYPDYAGWTYVGRKTADGATGSAGRTWAHTISSNNASLKYRYDVLIVNGAGVYFFMDAGDVYIDTVPPEIDNTKTFLSLSSDVDNDSEEIDYSLLTLINANNFTNDDLWAYYYITDGASGVETVTYTDETGSHALEKVTLIRDGVTYEKGDGKGDGYYRLKMTANQGYVVRATDLAKNYVNSARITPSIDKNDLSIAVTLTTSAGTSYTSGVFTKSDYVNVRLKVGVGASFFKYVEYAKVDRGETPTVWTVLNDSCGIGEEISISGVNSQEGTITFRLSQEQNQDYYFRAYNGVEARYAKYVEGEQKRPFGLPNTASTYPVGVAIDRTAPVINLSVGNYTYLTNEWHATPQRPVLSVNDPNVYGSGVQTVRVTYTIGQGLDATNHSFVLEPIDGVYTTEEVLDHYVNYTVTMTDEAGNVAVQTLLPRIDSVRPLFIDYDDGKTAYTNTKKALDDIYGDLTEKTYTVGNNAGAYWTNMNVEALFNVMHGISGAKLYYRSVDKGGTFTDRILWNEWGFSYDWANTPVPNEDDGKTVLLRNASMLFNVVAGGSLDRTYQIKIVSNAGPESDVYTVGRISIDKEKPIITGIVRTNGNVDAWGTPSEHATDIADTAWTKNAVSVNLGTNSTLVSGYSFYYNISQTGENWQKVTVGYVNNDQFSLDYISKTFLHTISKSVNDEDYQYYIESNSGMRSDVYHVNGVKIDTISPRFDLSGKTGSSFGTPLGEGKLNESDRAYFDGLGDDAFYNIKNKTVSSDVWTSSNSVVVCVDIERVNTSGLDLKINGVTYEHFDYADYADLGHVYRYYIVDKRADLKFSLVSGAGKEYNEDAFIYIDNVIPMLFVSGITGDKSTNWDNTVENSWYTSVTRINFKVGTLVKDGSDYVWSDALPLSSYNIEYTLDNGATWINYGTNTMMTILGNPFVQNSYRFRIRNNAGMTYYLGEDAFDNNNQTSHESVAATAARCNEILTAVGAVRSHLSATDSYIYNLNVDSNVYYVLDTQVLSFVNNGQNIDVTTKTDFATYTYELYRNGGYRPVASTAMEFKRGDLIRISYRAKVSDDYIHNYTDYGAVDSEGAWITAPYEGVRRYSDSDVYTLDDGVDYEQRYVRYRYEEYREEEGDFTYRFSDSSLTVVSHFIKLLDVTYGNEILYKQVSAAADVTAATRFTYKTASGATSTVNIPLEVNYAEMNDPTRTVDPTDPAVGAYLVKAKVSGDVNVNSFRLKNPMTVLLVKYFEEKVVNGEEIANSSSNPYSINTIEDLAYVSSDYYDSYEKIDATTFLLGASKSYLASSYLLKEDLTVVDDIGIRGTFTGSFAGDEHVVTMAKDVATGKYGFFEEFAGEAKGLVVRLANRLGVQGGASETNVGIFASTMTAGRVTDVRTFGDIVIVSSATDGAIGGFVGSVTGGQIGAANGSIYVDAVIENEGSAINSADIGGVAGYVGSDAIFNYVYAYTFVTVYNVGNEVHAGALAGALENSDYGDSRNDHFFANRYLANNTFVNDQIAEGFAGTDNDVNDYDENYNTVKSLTYDRFVNNLSGEGATVVTEKTIRTLVLTRLYDDFGLEYGNGFNDGTGATAATAIAIDTKEKLAVVDKYMNVCFNLTEDLDLADKVQPIGLHKVFNGKFDGKNKTFSNVGAGYETSADRIGLFAELSGSVTNLVLNNVAMDATSDRAVAYAGAVTARLVNGSIGNVIAIGSVRLSADERSYVGAIAGYVEEGTIYDAFSIVNVAAKGNVAYAGGIVGYSDGVVLGKDPTNNDATVFALGRVESDSVYGGSDAVVGAGYVYEVGKAYAVENNAYQNGIVVNNNFARVTLVNFDSMDMRNATFGNGTNVFGKVFGQSGIYRLKGSGTVSDPFAISTSDDFAYIDQMLYADYNITRDITFTDFKTVGKGLVFRGSINGKNSENWSAEEGTVSTLMNVTDALVDTNSGTISDFGVNVHYESSATEYLTFGAIANENRNGTIRNVTVGGRIVINATPNATVVVSGFIGVGNGGTVETDSKVQNSISGLEITVNGAGTVYAGGYIGQVDGEMTLTYGIGSGKITVENSGIVYAGALVGAVNKETTYKGVEATADYRYEIKVNGEQRTDLFGYVSGDADVILKID